MKKLLILLALFLSVPANAAQYALVTPGDTIIDSREFTSTPPDILASQGVNWRPYVDTNPGYDPATQVKTGPVITVQPTQVTRVWTVTAMTAPELDAYKTSIVDGVGEVAIKGQLDLYNSWRVSVGLASVTEAAYRATLKSYVGANPPAPDATKVAVLKGTGGPTQILQFSATISPTSVAAAAFTDQSFTVTGLATTDEILNVTFTAGLLPTTISYMPIRVSAANTMVIRFAKISTGAITPNANQAIIVTVAR